VQVSEADLNGRGADPTAARVLVVCSKYETGYDDPRLAAMFVDRCAAWVCAGAAGPGGVRAVAAVGAGGVCWGCWCRLRTCCGCCGCCGCRSCLPNGAAACGSWPSVRPQTLPALSSAVTAYNQLPAHQLT
jgi:hypothetical protein